MSTLVIPDGFKAGCLPATEPPGRFCGFARDHIELIVDRQEIADLIEAEVTIRQDVKYISNQDGAGSCTANAGTWLYWTMATSCGYGVPILNPWSVYGGCVNGRRRGTSGGRDAGSGLGETMRAMRDVGVLPESVHPQGGWGDSRIQGRPSERGLWAELPKGWEEVAKHFRIHEFWQITSVEEIISAVLRGFGVNYGWGGHSCYIVDLVDENTAVYANSWGNWGNAGFGTIKLREVDFRYEAYCYRSVVDPGGWQEVAADVLSRGILA